MHGLSASAPHWFDPSPPLIDAWTQMRRMAFSLMARLSAALLAGSASILRRALNAASPSPTHEFLRNPWTWIYASHSTYLSSIPHQQKRSPMYPRLCDWTQLSTANSGFGQRPLLLQRSSTLQPFGDWDCNSLEDKSILVIRYAWNVDLFEIFWYVVGLEYFNDGADSNSQRGQIRRMPIHTSTNQTIPLRWAGQSCSPWSLWLIVWYSSVARLGFSGQW